MGGPSLLLQKASLCTCTMDSSQGHGSNNPPLSLLHHQNFPSLLDYHSLTCYFSHLKKENKKHLFSLYFSSDHHAISLLSHIIKLLVRIVQCHFAKSSPLILFYTPSNQMIPTTPLKLFIKVTSNVHVAKPNCQCPVLILHTTGHCCSLPHLETLCPLHSSSFLLTS